MKLSFTSLGLFAAAFGALALGACSDIAVPKAKSTTGRSPSVAEIPENKETVRGEDDPPIVTLKLGSRLKEKRLSRTEELPSAIIVPTTNLKAVPVTAALQAVLSGTDVALSWESGSFDTRLVTVTNLSGPLPRVVDKICSSARIFCAYRSGLLEIKEKETFIIELPSTPTKTASSSSSGGGTSGAAGNTMAETISELAHEKVKIDQQGGNLIYTTDVDGQERVREYLGQLRNGRPLLVMQLYIWEVTLNKENGTSINWSSFSVGKIGGYAQNIMLSGSTAFTSLSSPGVSLGATMKGKLDATSVLQFLSTQGQVQTISSPQLTFVSGSSAEFRVGGKQRYISQVGQLTTSSVTGTSTSGVGTNTVSTDSLDTGLKVDINGSYESGVISALLQLELQDVVSLNPTTTQSMTIDLPETSERKVSTSLRVRPGDNLVLAGLVSSRDENTRDGVPLPFGSRVVTSSDDQFKNSELVILVKPSVVLFSDSGAEEEGPHKGREVPEAKNLTLSSMPDPVVIDKDGTKVLKLPDEAASAPRQAKAKEEAPRQAAALTDARAPVVAQPSETTAAKKATYVASSTPPNGRREDEPPVDQTLLQRGFSHAYDDLLVSGGAEAGGGT